MKKNLVSVFAFLLLSFFAPDAFAQKQVSMSDGPMPLNAKSQQAKKFAAMGISHVMNVERELAYQDFKAAVENDPNFTVALSYLASLSEGETRKELAKRAKESASGKSEAEKLFADLADDATTQEKGREIWAKLHTLYPNDRSIGYYFCVSREKADERFAAMTDYIQKFPDEAAIYNHMAYYYLMDKKDNAKAKEYFEKYIQLNPSSANPYDSMGEFYLTTGDVQNAEKYYKMALEKYPFMVSSIEALHKIQDGKKKADKN